MFINPLTAASTAMELFEKVSSLGNKKDDKKSINEFTDTPYDLNNMSLDQLKAMTMDLAQNGKLSDQDTNNFINQIAMLHDATGIANDAQVNMIQLYQDQIQKTNAEPKNVASMQKSLEILNGVQARSGAQIPQFV